MRVVVKIMVPFWVLMIIRHLIFRVPQKGAIILTNHPYTIWVHGPIQNLRMKVATTRVSGQGLLTSVSV